MAYQTTIQSLIDYVLIRLRKTTLAGRSITDISGVGYPYENLILGLVTDTLREIERAWDWQELRTTQSFTIDANTAINSSTGPANGSRLMYSRQAIDFNLDDFGSAGSTQVTNYPLCWDVTTSTAAQALIEIPSKDMEALHLTDQDNTTGSFPTYFALSNLPGGTMQIKVWPIPTTQRTIKARMVLAHPEPAAASLGSTSYGTDLPKRLVGMGALLKANQERGSNLGAPDSALAIAYENFLIDLVAEQMTDEDLTGYPE